MRDAQQNKQDRGTRVLASTMLPIRETFEETELTGTCGHKYKASSCVWGSWRNGCHGLYLKSAEVIIHSPEPPNPHLVICPHSSIIVRIMWRECVLYARLYVANFVSSFYILLLRNYWDSLVIEFPAKIRNTYGVALARQSGEGWLVWAPGLEDNS